MKTLKEYMDVEEKKYLRKLMQTCASNNEAARRANTTRTQLFRLLDKHGLERSTHANERSDQVS